MRESPVEINEETGQITVENWPLYLINAILLGLTIALISVSLGVSSREVASEKEDPRFLATIWTSSRFSIHIFFAFFFYQVLFDCVAQLCGPTLQLEKGLESSNLYTEVPRSSRMYVLTPPPLHCFSPFLPPLGFLSPKTKFFAFDLNFHQFKWSMLLCLTFTVIMIVAARASFVPWDWCINYFVAIPPMPTIVFSHMLLPIALNPAVMAFSW